MRITYKVHDVVIPESNDPTKTISKTVFLAEGTHAENGMIGFDAPDRTIATGKVILLDSVSVIRGEGAAADTLDFIEFGSAPDINDRDLVWIQQGAEAITIAHNTSTPPANSGAILLLSKANKKMISTRMILLQRQGSNFQEIAYDGFVGNGGVLVEDESEKAIIVCGTVASAVNHLKISNAATGNDVILEPAGTDTNIGVTIQGKGTGRIKILEQIVNNIRESTGAALAVVITGAASIVNHFELKPSITTADLEINALGTDANVGIKITPKGSGVLTMGGNVIHEGRNEEDKGTDIVSASILTLGNDGNFFDITGTNTINEILATGWQAGVEVVLQFDAILTITNNSGGTNDILTGDGANITTAAGFVLGLRFNGTDWRETFRNSVSAGGAAKSFFVNQTPFNLTTVLQYLGIGGLVKNTVEVEMRSYIPLGFTWSNLSVNIRLFGPTGPDPTFKTRDDGVDGNQVVTVTATGAFEDVSNTDTVAANSLVNYVYGGEPTGGGSVLPTSIVTVVEI